MTLWPDMPDCGVYLVWPTEGSQWIHPEDAELASQWIPSTRVWRRSQWEDGYYRLHYGNQAIRVRPSMWHRVDDEGYSIGDPVEILGRFLENEPCIGRVVEIRFHKPSGRIHYTIESRELVLPRPFLTEDLRRLEEKVHLRASDFQSAVVPAASGAEGEAGDALSLRAEGVEKPATANSHRDDSQDVDRDHGPEAHQQRWE